MRKPFFAGLTGMLFGALSAIVLASKYIDATTFGSNRFWERSTAWTAFGPDSTYAPTQIGAALFLAASIALVIGASTMISSRH